MGLDEELIRQGAGISSFGSPLRILDETGSTNADALAWAQEGAPEGAVVVAEHQTAGRGRKGRTWVSKPGEALLFSLILRPATTSGLPLLSTAVGVGACEAVRSLTRLSVLLKWPNDLMVEDRKLAGILVETRLVQETGPIAVVGLGLNFGWSGSIPLPEVAAEATGIATEMERSRLGPAPRREHILRALLGGIERRYRQLDNGDIGDLVSTAESLSSLVGREVVARLPVDGSVTGLVTGLTEDGALELETASGYRVLTAGEVESVRRS